jgi:hypothetical protein
MFIGAVALLREKSFSLLKNIGWHYLSGIDPMN